MNEEIVKVLQDVLSVLETQPTSTWSDCEDEEDFKTYAPIEYSISKVEYAICMLQGGDCK